jgi:hypothetical protein
MGCRTHFARKVVPMWSIKLEDIHRAKGQLQARRAKIEAKYLEDTKTLDADIAEIETFEHVASAFAAKHQSVAEPEAAEAEAENDAATDVDPVSLAQAGDTAASPEANNGAGARGASRWRLHLDPRTVPEAEVGR